MKRCLHVLLLSLSSVATPASQAAADPPATVDLAIINAKVWTGNPDRPHAKTIWVAGDRIIKVGDDDLAAPLRIMQDVRIIDAKGKRVIPGLIDCHTHIVSGGLTLSQLRLREATSKANFVERVKQYSHKLGPDEWVRGRGWTVESWKEPIEPTREWIDSVTTNRPAYLKRMDGHQALANSVALRLAGITKETPDPPGGVIVRDPQTHEPTGILKDAAMSLVSELMPQPSHKQKREALRKAKALFNRFGVTMIHDMSLPGEFELFTRETLTQAKSPREPRLRIYSFCQTDRWFSGECAAPVATNDSSAGDWVRAAGFKAYMDGSLGSKTAFMHEPYSDNDPTDPGARGLLSEFATAKLSQPRDMFHRFLGAAESGAQVCVHAIGDQAVHLLLDDYQRTLRIRPNWRPRVEHAQHLLPEDIPRFGKLGVIASMQPLHKADDGRYAEKRLGPERCKTSYAFKSLLDSKAVVCFGSDWPVVSNNPMLGIEAAVTGRTLDGKVFVPEQNITVEQALRCYTGNAAYACFMEDRLGVIKPGYLADLVILDQDILSIAHDRISKTLVDTTIVGGTVVWTRPKN